MQPVWGLSGAWHVGIMVLIVAFWGVVIVGVVLAIRWLGKQGERRGRDQRVRDRSEPGVGATENGNEADHRSNGRERRDPE